MLYDVRAIANFVLDLAEQAGHPITNMQINKIVYFLHADYLASFDRPLVNAKIEAWEHGPVFRELYREFKGFGDRPISARATKISADTGTKEVASYEFAEGDADRIATLCGKYVGFSASALRSLSHLPNGPWDQVWNHETSSKASMRITDESILKWYKDAKH